MDTMANVVRALAAAGADSSLVGQTLLALVNPVRPGDNSAIPEAVPVSPALPPSDRFKQITYTDADGTRTTIGIPRPLFLEAASQLGGEKPASKFLRKKALEAPAEVRNRSGWVQDQLTEHLFAMAHKSSA